MATQEKHPPGPPMTLGNMREFGVHHLMPFCLNDTCRHQALIDVSDCPDNIETGRLPCSANAIRTAN